MRGRCSLAMLALAACGRIGFDATATDAAGTSTDGTSAGGFTSIALPDGGTLNGIVVSADGATRYAVAYAGAMYRSTDAATWTPCGYRAFGSLALDANGTIYASGIDDVYASGDGCATWQPTGLGAPVDVVRDVGGTIYAANDHLHVLASGTWTTVTTPVDGGASYAFAATADGSTQLLGSYGNGIARRTGSGTWQDASNGLANGYINALVFAPTDPTVAYAYEDDDGSTPGDVVKSTDGGATWTSVYSAAGESIAVDPADESHVVFAPYSDFGVSSDGMQSYTNGLRGALAPYGVVQVMFEPNGNLLAATENGVWEAPAGTTTWHSESTGLHTWWTFAIVPSGSDVYLGTESGVLHSTNGGPFTLGNAGVDIDAWAPSMFALNGSIYAGGRELHQSSDGGSTWKSLYTPDAPDWYQVYSIASDGTRIYAGTGTRMLYADPPYASWTPAALGGGAEVNDVAYANGTVWAATSSGLFESTDRGSTYRQVTSLAPTDPYAVAALDDGTIVVGDSSAGIFVGTAGGSTWTNVVPNETIERFCSSGATIVATSTLAIQVSHDHGATWTSVPGLADHVPLGCAIDPATGDLLVGTFGSGLWRGPMP